jgi:hypothetical protein
MMNPFSLMGGLGAAGSGGSGLNPFAGLPGGMGGGGGGMNPAMLSNLYMQGGFNRRLPGMMEQVITTASGIIEDYIRLGFVYRGYDPRRGFWSGSGTVPQ